MGTPSVAVAQNSSAAAHVCFVGQAGPTGLVMCLGGGQCAEQNNVVTTFRSFEQLSRCGLHRSNSAAKLRCPKEWGVGSRFLSFKL